MISLDLVHMEFFWILSFLSAGVSDLFSFFEFVTSLYWLITLRLTYCNGTLHDLNSTYYRTNRQHHGWYHKLISSRDGYSRNVDVVPSISFGLVSLPWLCAFDPRLTLLYQVITGLCSGKGEVIN